jgi:hypothetical protein
MAEETTTPKTEEEAPERTVPYARFKEINDRLAKEREQRTELEARMQQLEDRDKTDVERLTKELERAQKTSEQASKELESERQQRVQTEKAAWLSAAAAKANFHNPDVAAKMVDLTNIEDSAAAEKAVKGLAKDNDWLVKAEQKQSPLQRVGIAGAEQQQAQQQGLITPEQQEREWGTEILKGLDPSAVSDDA